MAVLQEVHKRLSESEGRTKLIREALRSLCNTDNFLVYRHSPPKMVKACHFIKDKFGDKLEESLHVFYKRFRLKDNTKLQKEFCDDTIKVCLPGQRDVDIRMAAPAGMTVDEANEKISKQLSGRGGAEASSTSRTTTTTKQPRDQRVPKDSREKDEL